MKKKYLFLVVILLFFNFSYSQSEFCGFDAKRSKLRENPNYIALEKASEQRIKDAIQKRKLSKSSSTVLTIPVVIHVMHLGEAVGTGTNITDAQIQSSIDNLNNFYTGQTTNSPLDFQIQFQLAKRDPDCNATTGINRIDASAITNYSSHGIVTSGSGANEDPVKDLSRWPETDYLNIWIVSEFDNNNGGSGIQGYANFFNGNLREGSVMMYTVFGYDPNNANSSWPLNFNRDNSTVVHEVGHYFHLYHTFQGDNGGGSCPGDATVGTDSDGCADTVPHKRETSTCPTQNTCTGANWADNNTINNIMSYYNCTDRMTADQKTRVRAAMEGTSIVNSKGALVPDPGYTAPVAVCNTNSVTTNSGGIRSVELNGVTFSSGSSSADGGNIDKTASCSNYFEIDASVSNTLKVGMYTVNFQQLGVWIDWNDDGDFDDEAEQQHLSNDIAASTTIQQQLIYPTNIPYNDYVRLRLIADGDDRYSGNELITSACFTGIVDGQSEDYTIYVKSTSPPPPAGAISWTGTASTDWATVGNWSTNTIPTATDAVSISSTPANQPVIAASTGAIVNNLTVDVGASLSVTNGGSLIVKGTSTGNITYNLAIADTNWHLVSSPLVGEGYDNAWVVANSIASGSGANRGIATYQNGTPNGTTGPWTYMQENGTGTFDSGIGYSTLRTAAGNYGFTGTFPTTDVTPTISQNYNNWNLIGNPYPSYINIATFLAANTANISLVYQAIYVWNGTAYNSLTTGYMHPGQAFFVYSNVANGTASFTEAMQESFLPSFPGDGFRSDDSTINIILSDATSTKETQINYLDGKTLGLDPGFDLGMFDGTSSSLRVYTHLIEDNEGIAFGIQALPNSDYESMIVPMGVKADAGKEITFSVEAMNLPTDVNVYLEDKEANIFTRLDETNTEYTVTLSEALDGVGRFYIHTSTQALGVSNVDLVSVSVYSANQKIHFSGLPEGSTLVTLYDVLGKVILEEKITENTSSISTGNISKGGIYLIHLTTEKGTISKKIVLQ